MTRWAQYRYDLGNEDSFLIWQYAFSRLFSWFLLHCTIIWLHHKIITNESCWNNICILYTSSKFWYLNFPWLMKIWGKPWAWSETLKFYHLQSGPFFKSVYWWFKRWSCPILFSNTYCRKFAIKFPSWKTFLL
jgi:hypothetical protein